MTVRLPADLFRRSAQEGARLVALAYLDEIDWAQRRLADPHDVEALHDFRVGLRRLRSCTRAYRSQLKGSVSKKIRRELRDLTSATNPGRDTEVKLAWLHGQAERLGAGESEGLGWLIGRLEGRQYEAFEQVTGEVARRFSKLASRLRRRLGTFQVQVTPAREQQRPAFGAFTSGLIRDHATELGESLSAVKGPDDVTEAHAARIRAKRLRYLMEPIGRRAPGARVMVSQLKQLQDLLGTLHDMHVLAEEIESGLTALSRSLSERQLLVKPGLVALERLADEHALESFAGFRAAWGESRAERFLSRALGLGAYLAGSDQPEAGREIQPTGTVGRLLPAP
jgi:CHAD domain-containing protein